MNYKETLNYIHSLGNFGMTPTLDRINNVLLKLGSPQDSFEAIHIAGTNGKGSVSAMLSNAFCLSGKKTGLFISPYILDFRERIQINGEFITENELCEFAQKVIETGVELTQFEFITAVAFLYFKMQKCDIVIAETGLGGRLDATNTLTNVKASVITKIGLDHTEILGDTIEKITREKCGIIKNNNVITSFNQEEQALRVLSPYNPVIPNKDKLKIAKSDAFGNTFIYDGEEYNASLAGMHQVENALIVIETAQKCGLDIELIKQAIAKTYFPARMELINKEPLVILDGAHNPDGAKALGDMMKQYDGKITAIVGMCADKDCDEVLRCTLRHCKKAIAVEIENMPRSLKADDLKVLAEKYCPCDTAQNYSEALEKVVSEDVIFVFGSLYLASAIREKLKNFFKR